MEKYCKVCGKRIPQNSKVYFCKGDGCYTRMKYGMYRKHCIRCGVEITEENKSSFIRICTCKDCEEKQKGVFRQYRMIGLTNDDNGMKRCSRCGNIKEMTDFPVNANGKRSRWCKECGESPIKGKPKIHAERMRVIHFRSEDGNPAFDGVKMAHEGSRDGKCYKCALWDYPNQCEKYDCEGHYIRYARNISKEWNLEQ